MTENNQTIQTPAGSGQNNQEAGDQQTQSQQQEEVVNFEEFLAKQDDKVKAAFETHIVKLRNAVKATRDERDAIEAQLHDIKKTLGESPEKTAEKLAKLISDLGEAKTRASFFETAVSSDVQCRNPQAAYAIAVANKLFDDEGRPKWREVKKLAPELFGKPIPDANPGEGTGGSGGPVKQNINSWIRNQARGE